MKYEQIETYALAAIGLAKGVGELIVSEVVDRFIAPRGLWKVDMEALNKCINESGAEYNGR